jgi:uncharacterized DUF497 family protein
VVRIKKLIWNEWNVEHISKNGISVPEVESAINDNKAKCTKIQNGRIILLGRHSERYFSLVLTELSKNKYYVITARDMDSRERLFYERDNKR